MQSNTQNTRLAALFGGTLVAALAVAAAVFAVSAQATQRADDQIMNIELSYLTDLHTRGTQLHPSVTPLLMSQFINAGKQEDGINLFENLGDRFDGASATIAKTAHAVLRASIANDVFLLKRLPWVTETVRLFDEARTEAPDNLLNRWLIGTTLAQLPRFVKQFDQAQEDLEWVLARLDEIPRDGLLPGAEREVYFQLARLHHDNGQTDESERFLKLSGYTALERTSIVRSQFAADLENGLTMSTPKVLEIVPGRVFAARGFEMMDFHFIVSDNGRELISIDAGTRPDTAERAHEALMKAHPGLPPISTVLVTHSHWDHVGGHRYFRDLNPNVKFVSRDNYHKEIDSIDDTEPAFKFFFSKHYTTENVKHFHPDQTVSERTTLTIDGTRFELIPIPGGETEDGLFIHMPDLQTTFVGDFIMPFIGAPFANEGNPEGLLETIDILASLDSRVQLHGHTPLTTQFSPASMLVKMKPALAELIAHTLKGRRQNQSRQQIQQSNFIPQSVFDNPAMQVPYMVIREGIISRVYEQSTGYWQNNLDGMDSLTHSDIGVILSNYLGVDEFKLGGGLKQLIKDGQYEAALKLSDWARTSYPKSEQIAGLRLKALIGLREKHQFTNPFKFLIYSEVAGISTPQLGSQRAN